MTTTEHTVSNYGKLQVTIDGDRTKEPMIFLPDTALSCEMCYNTFINYPKLQFIKDYFYFIFIDFPFMLPSAKSVEYKAPDYDMKLIAQDVSQVITQLGLKYAIGFATGSGAYIMSLIAAERSSFFLGLVLISSSGDKVGWSTEWVLSKKLQYQLAYYGMPSVVDDLLHFHFGPGTLKHGKDLVLSFTDYLNSLQPYNVMKFIAGYTKREDLPPLKQVDCKVLLFVGTESPYYEGTIQLMNKYNNANTAWIKVQNAGGLITEERPDSMVTSMILFLQGMGYLVKQKIEQSATPSITIE